MPPYGDPPPCPKCGKWHYPHCTTFHHHGYTPVATGPPPSSAPPNPHKRQAVEDSEKPRNSAARFTITVAGPITIPGGITVGDEFRVVGRCRVIAMAEDTLDVTLLGEQCETLPGVLSITLGIKELTAD